MKTAMQIVAEEMEKRLQRLKDDKKNALKNETKDTQQKTDEDLKSSYNTVIEKIYFAQVKTPIKEQGHISITEFNKLAKIELKCLANFLADATSLKETFGLWPEIKNQVIKMSVGEAIFFLQNIQNKYNQLADEIEESGKTIGEIFIFFDQNDTLKDTESWKYCSDLFSDYFITLDSIMTYLNSLTPIDTIPMTLITNLRANLQFTASNENKCLDELCIFKDKERIYFDNNGFIIVSSFKPYQFVIGLIEHWEEKEYIPVLKNNKNNRIINCFKWINVKKIISPYNASTLDNKRKEKASALLQIENDLKLL